jgi:hypothetical protein
VLGVLSGAGIFAVRAVWSIRFRGQFFVFIFFVFGNRFLNRLEIAQDCLLICLPSVCFAGT